MLAVSPTRQLVSVALATGIPAVGTAIALGVALIHGVPAYALALFGAGYLLTGIGVEVGIHRHFTHKAFKASPWLRTALGILGCTAGQGQVLYWTATHRKHHARSDAEEDPHSPYVHGGVAGFWYSHIGWLFDTERNQFVMQNVDELARDPIVRWVDRRYLRWLLLSFLVPTVIGGLVSASLWGAFLGFLWGGCVRLFAAQHMVFAVNSVCHTFGRQHFRTKDQSRDLVWLAPFTFGGFLHNTHHAFAYTANNATAWYTLDPGFWVIRSFEWMGAAWDVRRPSPSSIERKRIA